VDKLFKPVEPTSKRNGKLKEIAKATMIQMTSLTKDKELKND